MSKKKIIQFICQSCGNQQSKWMGRCAECGAWNSYEEEILSHRSSKNRDELEEGEAPQKLAEIQTSMSNHRLTNISEFDRVLGGGIVEGSLTLIGGEPGIGKSTLLMTLTSNLAQGNKDSKILYVSGEESLGQIAQRARRLCVNNSNIYFYHETSWQKIQAQIQKIRPSYLVIDSIQTTVSQEIQSSPGSVSQVREVTFELMNVIKSNNITTFVIGHISKDGGIAGPKILEHMVDTVLYFEGDQFGHYRVLRASKNRFGNTNEVGIFEMRETGLESVKNPSLYFLDQSNDQHYGRSLSMIVEGTRPIFTEIQALVVENKNGNGRRITQGIDVNRLSMLVAVIEKYLKIPFGFNDIYLNIVGGLKIQGRETDLSIMASILSSYYSKMIDKKTLFIGEVGLTGEVRACTKMEARLKEMSLMGYRRLVASDRVPKEFSDKYEVEIIGIKHVKEIEKLIF